MSSNAPTARLHASHVLTPQNDKHSCHLYDMHPAFSTGSAPSSYAAHPPGEPSSSRSATGPLASASGYPYAISTALPTAAFSAYSAWNALRPDISREHLLPGYPHHPAMAVPYSTTAQLQQPATASHSSARGRPQPAVPEISETPRSESPPPQEDNSQASGEHDKKRHGCWMCHKSFDRPSTLKKHLLVHTGEKAYACVTCGRRFGVSSNLNRHAKRCAARPINLTPTPGASASANPARATPSAPDATLPVAGPSTAPAAAVPSPPPDAAAGRKRKAPPAADSPPAAQAPDAPPPAGKGKGKRVRRRPSPTHCIPESLRSFDLTPPTKGTPVPLPPVRPFRDASGRVWEERDSFDENVAPTPYHPRNWKGRLPGPGLVGKDVGNPGGGQLLLF